MKNYQQPKWVKPFLDYFREGIKDEASYVGVEIEQFIVDSKTLEATPYAGPGGVKEIIEALMKMYPEARPIMGEDLLGFVTDYFTITLEPAAQLEISVFPMHSVYCLEKISNDFFEHLNSVLEPSGKKSFFAGCQPQSRVDDLTMIPKERYRLMDMHFKETGTGGRQMMRGSASVQVSVDFTSEEDFMQKIQAAHYFAPAWMLLCDNSKTFQGESLNGFLKRYDIWDRTDPARCGILPGVFLETYGFEDYIGFLGSMPPIFLIENGKETYTGFKTVSELYADKVPSREEVEHILSMAFPHVRLKKYLELRFADSVPAPYIAAYCALVRGLMYSPDVLSLVQQRIRDEHIDESCVDSVMRDLMANGWEGKIYGRPAREFAREILDLATGHLPENEKAYLKPFDDVINFGGIANVPVRQ